jgi:hypothetical protein
MSKKRKIELQSEEVPEQGEKNLKRCQNLKRNRSSSRESKRPRRKRSQNSTTPFMMKLLKNFKSMLFQILYPAEKRKRKKCKTSL